MLPVAIGHFRSVLPGCSGRRALRVGRACSGRAGVRAGRSSARSSARPTSVPMASGTSRRTALRQRARPPDVACSRSITTSQCAIQCAPASVTTWHDLARGGTTAARPRHHKFGHVALMGTCWRNVARPGTASGPPFESCTAHHSLRGRIAERTRFSGVSGPRGTECAMQCAMGAVTSWHRVARAGTTWRATRHPA